jgi:hypothetical protein
MLSKFVFDGQRKETIVNLRKSGKTFKEIGKNLGISKQRAYQILNHDEPKPNGRPRIDKLLPIHHRQLYLFEIGPGTNVYQNRNEKYYERKEQVLTHYGNGKCACVRCGFEDIRALSIDHIKGGGTKHKKHEHFSDIYLWLIRNQFPRGFRTLCMNCQWITKNENNFVRKIPYREFLRRQQYALENPKKAIVRFF